MREWGTIIVLMLILLPSFSQINASWMSTIVKFTVGVKSTPPTEVEEEGGGGGGIPYIPPSSRIVSPPPLCIDFVRWPVLVELVAGSSLSFPVTLKNLCEGRGEIKVSSTFPNWILVQPPNFFMEPNETKRVMVNLSIPSEIPPGDYKAVLNFSDGLAEGNFFMVRVKEPPEEAPIVMREVKIDKEEMKTDVRIIIYAPKYFETVEIEEEIPKDLASTVDFIKFETPPSEIIERDPIVKWKFEDVKAGEKIEILYSIPRILPEFTKYIYWPTREVGASVQKLPRFEIIKFNIPAFEPGKFSSLELVVKNPDKKPHRFVLNLELPEGWVLKPEINETIAGESEARFLLQIYVPPQALSGSYLIKALFRWDNTLVVREYTFIVEKPFKEVYSPLIPILLVFSAILLVFLITARKKSKFIGARKGG